MNVPEGEISQATSLIQHLIPDIKSEPQEAGKARPMESPTIFEPSSNSEHAQALSARDRLPARRGPRTSHTLKGCWPDRHPRHAPF